MADVVCAKTNSMNRMSEQHNNSCAWKLEVSNEMAVKLDQSLNLMPTKLKYRRV